VGRKTGEFKIIELDREFRRKKKKRRSPIVSTIALMAARAEKRRASPLYLGREGGNTQHLVNRAQKREGPKSSVREEEEKEEKEGVQPLFSLKGGKELEGDFLSRPCSNQERREKGEPYSQLLTSGGHLFLSLYQQVKEGGKEGGRAAYSPAAVSVRKKGKGKRALPRIGQPQGGEGGKKKGETRKGSVITCSGQQGAMTKKRKKKRRRGGGFNASLHDLRDLQIKKGEKKKKVGSQRETISSRREKKGWRT